jgi:hypothetical protein
MNAGKSFTFTLDIKVADVKDAGTDGDIYVKLKDKNDRTWEHRLDIYNHDDFKRGSTDTYSWNQCDIIESYSSGDFYHHNVIDISDLKCFSIENKSDDGLLVTTMELKTNKGFHKKCSNNHWADTDDDAIVSCGC